MRYRDADPPSIPILEWGDPLPLEWTRFSSVKTSIVPSDFKTRHGSGLVHWRLKGHGWRVRIEPDAAYGVTYPNGSRGIVLSATRHEFSRPQNASDSHSWRRRSNNGRSWWLGDLTVMEDSLTFADAQELPKFVDWESPLGRDVISKSIERRPPLEGHFHFVELFKTITESSNEILDAIQDDGFAASVYLFLRDNEIVRTSDNKVVSFSSDRSVGGFVAELRRFGESYDVFTFGLLGIQYSRENHFHQIQEFIEKLGYQVKNQSN